MPAAFTPAFAARLNGLCQIKVKEAQQGDRLTTWNGLFSPWWTADDGRRARGS